MKPDSVHPKPKLRKEVSRLQGYAWNKNSQWDSFLHPWLALTSCKSASLPVSVSLSLKWVKILAGAREYSGLYIETRPFKVPHS